MKDGRPVGENLTTGRPRAAAEPHGYYSKRR